jgi:hypothetical protein
MIMEGSNSDITISKIELGFSNNKAQILYQRLDEPVMKVIYKEKRYFTIEVGDQFKLALKEEQWGDVYRADKTNTSYQIF